MRKLIASFSYDELSESAQANALANVTELQENGDESWFYQPIDALKKSLATLFNINTDKISIELDNGIKELHIPSVELSQEIVDKYFEDTKFIKIEGYHYLLDGATITANIEPYGADVKITLSQNIRNDELENDLSFTESEIEKDISNQFDDTNEEILETNFYNHQDELREMALQDINDYQFDEQGNIIS